MGSVIYRQLLHCKRNNIKYFVGFCNNDCIPIMVTGSRQTHHKTPEGERPSGASVDLQT